VADGRPASLGQLGRSPLGLKHYKDTLDRVILSRFASVSDYLLSTVFGVPTEPAGKCG
jgi:hypothetical protein